MNPNCYLPYLASELLQIILDHIIFGTYAILSKSCAILETRLCTMIQKNIIQNPKTFGQNAMKNYTENLIDNPNIKEPWMKYIERCDLPLLIYNMDTKLIEKAFELAIKNNDYHMMRVLILLVSPRLITSNMSAIKNRKVFDDLIKIIGFKPTFDPDVELLEEIKIIYPLFLLPIFGAKTKMIDNVIELIQQIGKLNYPIFWTSGLGFVHIVEIPPKTQDEYSRQIGILTQAIVKYSVKLYSLCNFIEMRNDHCRKSLVCESQIIGSMIPYNFE